MKVFGQWNTWADAADQINEVLDTDVVALLGHAYSVAERSHRDQTRPAGEPYVQHLLEVVEIMVIWLEITDVDLLRAGLLHDVVEDTDVTLADVEDWFGERTAELVGQVTMAEVAPDQEKHTVRQAYLDRLRRAPAEVLRLKLADRYSNVQRLHTHPGVAKQRSYFAETVQHFLPLAAVDERLARLFGTWAEAYEYLSAPVDTLGSVEQLAAALHREQVDKCGTPYIEHIHATARIAKAGGASEHQQMAGLLHDAVEDTPCTLEQLRELGIPTAVVAMVDALSRRPGESQQTYLARLVITPNATLVKHSDIEHNLSAERIARLDPAVQDRLRSKYDAALRFLAGR